MFLIIKPSLNHFNFFLSEDSFTSLLENPYILSELSKDLMLMVGYFFTLPYGVFHLINYSNPNKKDI